jgi:fucose 4-O-acetylase-like acetyltransferase
VSKRYDWVDYAKGIGILLVVYAHIARGVFSAGIASDEGWYTLVDSVIYTFHMPLFFFLSGLFFYSSLQKRGGGALVAVKADTILYPYIVWSLLQGTVELMFSRYTNDVISAEDVVNLLEPRAQFWFLFALFMITVLAIPIYAALKQRYFLAVALAFSAVFVFSNAMPEFFHSDYLYAWFVFFAFGVWFNEIRDAVLSRSRALLGLFFVLFVFSQWLFHGYFGLTHEDGGAGLLVLALIAIMFVVLLAHVLSHYPGRFMLQLGYSSMAIYLMHVMVGSGVRVFLQKILHVENLYAHLALGFSAAVLIPLGVVKLCRRWDRMFLLEAPRTISGQYWYQKKFDT